MRMILRKKTDTNTLKHLVKVACDKYAAMENTRIASSLRNSKLDKLRSLIQNTKTTEAEIATRIKALNETEQKGTRFKSLLDVLTACADIQLNRNNFENAYELLNVQRSKLNNEKQWVDGFHFEKSLRNILIPKATRFVKKIENQTILGNVEMHRHIPKPITQLISPEFIIKERRRKCVMLLKNEITTLQAKLLAMKKLVVKNRHNELAAKNELKAEKFNAKALRKELTFYQQEDQAQRAQIEKQLMQLEEKAFELTTLQEQFKTQVDESEFLTERVQHSQELIEEAKDLIAEQGRTIDILFQKTQYLSEFANIKTQQLATTTALAERNLTAQRLENAKSKYSELAKTRDVIQKQGRQINGLMQELETTKQQTHHLLDKLVTHFMRLEDEKTELRISHVKDKKAATDKLVEVIKKQGRELNELDISRSVDSIAVTGEDLSRAVSPASSVYTSRQSPSPTFFNSPRINNWMASTPLNTLYSSDYESDFENESESDSMRTCPFSL